MKRSRLVPEEDVWLASQKSPQSRRAYRRDVEHFVRTLGIRSADERQRQRTDQDVAKAIRQEKWDQALTLIDRQLKDNPDNASALRQKFDVLAAQGQYQDAALAVADKLFETMQDDAQSLNNLAWALLTEEEYGGRFNDFALRLSRRANELTKRAQWAYLDTLALAEFKTDSIQKAIELEQKAIELSKTKADGAGIEDMQEALQRFRDASPDEAEAASAQLN